MMNFESEDPEYLEDDDRFDYEEDDREMFADPGGKSALRAATPSNPRIFPCPTCGRPDMLTKKDVDLHYQCDYCADAAEGGMSSYLSGEY